jgi:hypothetical protein
MAPRTLVEGAGAVVVATGAVADEVGGVVVAGCSSEELSGLEEHDTKPAIASVASTADPIVGFTG